MSDETTINITGLDKLIKAFKGKIPTLRVGILGDRTTRSPDERGKAALNNAEVGAIYEFKTDPERPGGSFLRVPISDNLEKEMEKAGAFDKEAVKKIIKEGTLVPFLEKVGVLAEGIVHGAFDSGGYGKWKPSNMKYKKNHQTLVETQQLRNSITSEVK